MAGATLGRVVPRSGARHGQPRRARGYTAIRTTGKRGAAGSEETGRCRDVAREVRERAVPAQQDREALQPEPGPEEGHDDVAGGARHPQTEGSARPDGADEVAHERTKKVRIADGSGPDPASLRAVAIARGPSVAITQEEPDPAFGAVKHVVDRPIE